MKDNQIKQLKEMINQADAIVVGGASGMSAAEMALFALFISHAATATLLHHNTNNHSKVCDRPSVKNIGKRGLKSVNKC